MNSPRILHTTCLALSAFALLALSACGFPRNPDLAAAYVSADLVAPGGGAATGRVESLLSRLSRHIDVGVANLTPNAEYEITADGVVIASFVVGEDGAAHIPLSPETLGIDPREHHFAVREPDGPDVLVMSDPDATNGGTVLAENSPLAAFAGGHGAATFFASGGVWHFEVAIEGVDPGDYELWIDGTQRATIDAATGSGKVDFSSAPRGDELLLDFDPRLAAVEIRRGDEYFFAGTGHANILGIDMCLQATRGQAFVAASEGDATATLATRANCSRTFRVQLNNVPMGDYDLFVGGVARGIVSVGADENGVTEGDLTFATNAGENGLSLDFDLAGEPIEVRASDELFFSIDAFAP
jgi:hypothetical protein